MKKFFCLIIVVDILASCSLTRSLPTTTITKDLTQYNFVYVVPTSAVTSGILIETNTVNPSEMITGYLMKKGYSSIPSIDAELKSRTLVVTYGNTSSTSFSHSFVARKGVIIQFRDAETHELIATSEAEGASLNTETEALIQAINSALNSIFDMVKKN